MKKNKLKNKTIYNITKLKLQVMDKINETTELKQKELLEKDDEIKKLQREYQQELIKLRADNLRINKCSTSLNYVIKIHGLCKIVKISFHKKEVICYLSFDKHIRFLDWNAWNIKTIKARITLFKGHKQEVTSIKYGSDGLESNILSGSSDFSVCLWDIRTNKIINISTGHKATSYDIEYSPFVNIVCYASYDHTICFWSTKMNNQEHCINTSKNKDNGIKCIKFIRSKNNDCIKTSTLNRKLAFFFNSLCHTDFIINKINKICKLLQKVNKYN
ncbi:hypothetical protein RFI_00822 [Reticulomyxa filosa]|uniref:Uncharacterized protein n=1 Tax=Reticulomyxa filosa TaxID=46433 RepID=X6PCH9_RETFI|nr:hypothetical protein RFI_00822 [Reticulomyxa filosa]|eukprot:ETO36240.1 hypothetical protein RFI_00822 [Reticulomyxa filosa]